MLTWAGRFTGTDSSGQVSDYQHLELSVLYSTFYYRLSIALFAGGESG